MIQEPETSIAGILARAKDSRNAGNYEGALALDDKALTLAVASHAADGLYIATVAECHYARGKDLRLLRRHDEAITEHEKALGIRRSLGHAGLIADSLNGIGTVHWHAERYVDALTAYLEAYDGYVAANDRLGIAYCQTNMGLIRWNFGELDEALALFRTALSHYEWTQDPTGLPSCLSNIGLVLQEMGDLDGAAESYEKSIERYIITGESWGIANATCNLGVVYEKRGDMDKAEALYARALELHRELGDARGKAMALGNLGQIAYNRRDLAQSRKLAEEAVSLARMEGCREIEKDHLKLLTSIAVEEGNWREAFNHKSAFHEIADSLTGEASRRRVAELERRFETDRARKDAELERLRNVELKAAIDTRDRIFSVIAHDLRGPIGSLAQALEVHLASSGPEDRHGHKAPARMASDALALLENLLAWARSQQGGIIPRPRRFPVAGLIDHVHALFESRAESKAIALIDDSEAESEAFADPDLAEAVLRNLVSNALKFTDRGGSILISSSTEGDFIRVAVADSGTGIAPGRIDALLAGKDDSRSYGTEGESGSGLGLGVAMGFAAANGGSFGMESEPNTGTTAWYTMPAAKRSAE